MAINGPGIQIVPNYIKSSNYGPIKTLKAELKSYGSLRVMVDLQVFENPAEQNSTVLNPADGAKT